MYFSVCAAAACSFPLFRLEVLSPSLSLSPSLFPRSGALQSVSALHSNIHSAGGGERGDRGDRPWGRLGRRARGKEGGDGRLHSGLGLKIFCPELEKLMKDLTPPVLRT